ncbi:TetR/AcrR family transcriptional regulator [Pollutimonas sp. M17]|uniref:TetR/AcrR family transcriptional regulator n=1 Tax=Pollutimonas sp. M17 TaxID=2962065 RepID=UPI0021F3E66E|nr:TetR/AcrR family transcriptional regulator [Pollutimonas sp. M17]UYO92499.1 TetR/AcrR family transcriptional regulator [Pollutimonas sp. M17]
MDTKLSRKEATHKRIVEVAARAIRRGGYGGVGVADIMKEAGLTHGGFYAHFPSRDAMLAEAVQYAGRQVLQIYAERTEELRKQGASPFRALVESYLSERHLEGLENGCPVAALASDMPRQVPEVQAASRERVHIMFSVVRQVLPEHVDPDQAAVIASTLVGTLSLARALGGGPESKTLLASSRAALLARYDDPGHPAKDDSGLGGPSPIPNPA